jgi:hypothetical protein
MKVGDLIELFSPVDGTMVYAEEVGYNNSHVKYHYLPPKTIGLLLEIFDQPQGSGFKMHKILIEEKICFIYEHTLKIL